MSESLVSIIIVNHNGSFFLIKCLEAVFNCEYRNIEIIVVDNGSTDESLAGAQNRFTSDNIKYLILGKNYGPSYARNKGLDVSNGEYVAFLDNDTVPEKDWLRKPVELMGRDSAIGACQCKLLLLSEPQGLDYVGDYLSPFGFLIQTARANELDKGQYDFHNTIFSAKSAAMVARKTVIDLVGGFDADYFIYVEETDLCWRMWLHGYKVIFVYESRVYHMFGGSVLSLGSERQNYFAKFHGSKNYITTLIKNFGTENLIKVVPMHILIWTGISFWLILHRRTKDALYILQGILWVFFNLNIIIKKRNHIQSARVIQDKQLMPYIMQSKSISYFYRKISSVHKIGLAEGFCRK